jgi:membrane-associated phospholipid phosphatase
VLAHPGQEQWTGRQFEETFMLAFVRQIAQDGRVLLLSAFRIMKGHLVELGAFALIVSALAIAVHNYDAKLYNLLKEDRGHALKQIARILSKFGELQKGPAILAGGIWGVGFVIRRRTWQMAAIACLLAACLAGATADIAKMAAGRPRPKVEMRDQFHGVHWSDDFHGFVSAHAATSFGAATALTVALPAIGVLVIPAAALVTWSRIALGNHYPSDCLLGAALGFLFGVPLGLAVRELGLGSDDGRPSV